MASQGHIKIRLGKEKKTFRIQPSVSLNQGIDIWDGLINGRPVETDTFVYVIEAEYSNGEKGVIGGDFTVMKWSV